MLFSRNPGTFKLGDKLYTEGAKKKPTPFNDYQNDDSTMHFSKESQYDAGPAMPRSVAAGSAKPQYEDDPMTEPEMTKPSLFGGMDRPERAKPKWYDYVASIGIPALLGGLSGEGAIQGGLLGLSDVLKSRAGRSNQEVADWEKDREFGQKERALTAAKDLAAAKLGVDIGDKKFDRKLKLQELDLKKNPPAKPYRPGEITQEDALEAQDAIDKANKLGIPLPKKAENIIKFWQMGKKVDPLDYVNID